MPLCNSRPLRVLIFGLLVSTALAQSVPPSEPTSPAARALAGLPPLPAQSTSAKPAPKPETQQPLDVDRDPVVSPDTADNAPMNQKQEEAEAAGQSSAQPGEVGRNDKGVFTLTRNVDEVILNVTVLDSEGHLVNDLKKEDVKIWEDNVPQTIASFQHQDIPVSIGILVDNSGSMRDKRSAVNAAALDMVKASNPQDESFIVNFSDEAFIDQDFTADLGKLREGLSHIDSKGGTAMYDAVVASADQLSKYAKRPKQALLIITDGEDNASTFNLEQTIRRIQALQGPVVYSIGLLFGDESGRESKRARRALKLLSDETGGLAFFPKSLAEVDEIATEVAHDIRNQYTIGYHSTKPPEVPGFRSIRVEAHGAHGKLTVRTRSGYYSKASAGNDTQKK
ncbi:VWA domain-containing protein [Silvibacterium acidisoli]|uniref:VWA domain-containing protein n=1 Tax=Acidobacteriaceae bacterium ZG23-2 TaxID=2883246 RepID=UPI00406C06DE